MGFWYIKEHRGLATSASLASLDSAALSLVDPPRMVRLNPPNHHLRLRAGARVGQMPGALGHTKRLLTWRPEEKPRSAFYPSALRGPFFISAVCCSWFPLSSSLKGVSVSLHRFLLWRSHFPCASPTDSGTEVTLFKDGLGSEFKDLPPGLSTPTRRPFHSSLPGSWGLLLVWAFPPFTLSYP